MLDQTEHAVEAERLLDLVDEMMSAVSGKQTEMRSGITSQISILLAKAQVHATLATVPE